MIRDELDRSQYYYLETETPGTGGKSLASQVNITFENVAKVEAMIAHDGAYSKSSDRCSQPDEKWENAFNATPATPDPYKDYPGYRGSPAFWLTLLTEYCKNTLNCKDIVWNDLKCGGIYGNLGITQAIRKDLGLDYLEIMDKWKVVFRKKFSNNDYFKFLIFNSICAIDAENSTRLNSDGVGRIELTERIVSRQQASGDFCDLLKNDNKQYELIDILSGKTTPKNSQHHARENFSFATKFCHYAAFYIFEVPNGISYQGPDYQDNYSIFDSVICKVLCSDNVTIGNVKWSAAYVKKLRENGIPYSRIYGDYQGVLDAIRKSAEKQTGKQISRNGLDHLLWYYYKGRGAGLLK